MSSELTYISTIQINNYTSIDAVKIDVIKTLARWFSNYYVYNEHAVESWVQTEGTEIYVLYNNTFQFELSHLGTTSFELTMYAVGRFRRHGSSCDFFEKVLDGLEQQLKHPSPQFETMTEAISSKAAEESIYLGTSFNYTHSNSVSDALPVDGSLAETIDYDDDDTVSKEDENDSDLDSDLDVDSEDEDEVSMNMNLRNMTDLQIEKYCELIGQCPRDECSEWNMVYNGGDIIRYSYCKFIQWGIEDKTVSNITISCAIFDQVTFTNYVFDNVTFVECVFKDIILNNTTFKNSKFIDCDLDSSIVPDDSCEVINFTDYIDDDDYYEDSEEYEEEEEEEEDRRIF
jgi:hypothetical protein